MAIPPNDGDKKKPDFSALQTSSARDIAAYIFMIIGIVLLFTVPLLGGLIVGFLFGIYFALELLQFFKSINEWINSLGLVRSLIVGGLILAFFVVQPAIFIGIGIAIAVKQIIFPDTDR